MTPPAPAASPGEATFGLELYEHEIDESLDTLVPLAEPEHGLLFFNPKLTVSDRLDPSVSLGIGYRHLFEGPKVILGGNLFYDSDNSSYDNHYNQFGFGGEVLTRWVDFRANYYLPEQNRRGINSKQTMSLSSKVTSSSQPLGPQTTSDSLSYSGYNLLETVQGMNETLHTVNTTETQTTHFWEQYESGMRGVDSEMGFLIPGLDKYVETRVFGGYYYFDNPFGKNVQGFKGRLEIRALPAVTLDAAYYENKEIVGSNWYYGIRISTPFDIANIAHGKNPFAGFTEGFKPQHTDDQERFNARLSENIIRNNHVALAQSNFIDVKDKVVSADPPSTYVTGTAFTTTTVLTLGGVPITITHVDSAATSPGNGTFESPYLTLSLANTDVVKRNIVLLHANSIFNSQTISLVAGQQLLGDSSSVTNYVKTDQLGTVALPRASSGTNMPIVTNPGGTIVTVAGNNVISGLNLNNAARAVYSAGGATGVSVLHSIISNMTTSGIELNPSVSTTVSNVSFSNNNQDIVLNGSGTTITNVTSTGAVNGSIDLTNTSGTTTLSNVTITNPGAFGLSVTNPGGTHDITGLTVTGGTGFGVDIVGGAGTFNFDSTTSLTNTGLAALQVNGGAANVTYLGSISQGSNAPLVAVIGGHTGTMDFQGGTLSATAGQGLLFDDANGTYNFLGTTTLTNGANLQILDASAGTFDFGTGTSITNGTNQDILVNNSTASMTYSGNVTESVGTLLQVNNHSTGTLQFDTGTLSATGGNGLQFNGADGTYKFLGTTTLNGGAAAIDIVNNSTGTFQFDTATTITNPSATAFFVNGGTANITYSGNITADTGFALQVLNHSTGTMNFNTGIVKSTAGIGVQFVNDSGTYNLADTRVSNSTGSAIDVESSPNGTFTFSSVTLANSTGSAMQLNGAGTVSVLGGTIDGAGGNGIFSQNTALTATGLTLGGTTAITGIGVQVINNDGTQRTVDISNDNIRSDGSGIVTTDNGVAKELTLVLDGNTIQTLNGGSEAIDVTGSALNSTIVKSVNGLTVTANGTGGGVFFNQVTFDASGTALTGTQVNAGTWNIGQGTLAAQRVLNDGVHLGAPSGSLNFGTLNIFNNAGTGLFANPTATATTFTLDGGGSGTINTTGGAAMFLDPLTTNLTFGTVTSTASPGAGITVSGLTSGSSLTIGTTTVSTSNGSGIVVTNSNGANINFGTTTVTSPGGSGIDLSGAGGANVTFGTTMITNPGASGIDMSNATGTFMFGNTTINGTAAGQTAFNLNGSSANVTALSLNVNGGGIGIDLRKTNGDTVIITNGGTIQNVGVGVQLGSGNVADNSQTADAFFTFDTTGGHNSTISGTVSIEARGLVSTASNVDGTYDFRNVTNFVGAQNFDPSAGTPFFVAATALGTGTGADPMDAAAYTGIAGTPAGTYIVLVNDGSTINIGASTITLQANDHVDTFGGGRTFAAGTTPVNILLPGAVQFTDPFGNGAATITGTGTLFAAASGDLLQNFTITLNGGTAISASGITNLSTNNLTINGTGNVFSLTNDSGNISLTNNSVNVSGGQLLGVSGGNATINLAAGTGSVSNTGGGGVNIAGTTGGSVTITGVSVTGATATPLTFDNNAATFNITGSTFAVNNGVTLLNIDTGTGNSTSDLTFGSTDTLTQTQGTIAIIGQGARNIDLSAQSFLHNTDTFATNAIESTGQSGGTISFGDVAISDFDGTTAVNLQGTGGAVTFKSLNVDTQGGAGVSTGGITFTPGTIQIYSTGGSALVMNGTTIGGGSATFGNVEADVPGAGNPGISLTNVTGTTLFTYVSVKVPAATGINLNNAGTVTVQGGAIDAGSGDGIHSVNTTLNASGLTIGGGSAPAGNGITIVNNDGTARLVTLSDDTITAQGDGIHTTDNGVAGELTLALNGDNLQTTSGGNFALNVIGSALNSTIVESMSGGTVTANGTGGGVRFDEVTFDASGAALSGTQVAAGTWNIGQGTPAGQRIQANGLTLLAPTGNLSFSTLNIFNNNGTGLLVDTKSAPGPTTFSLGTGAGGVDTTNGTALNIDPLTASLTFSNVKSTNAATNGVILNTVGGTVALGAVSVTNATGTGLEMINSGGAVTATSVTVNGAATGLQFGTNAGGSFTVSGATSLTNITGTGIDADGATGSYQFAGVTDTFSGAGRGIDLRNSDVTQFSTGTITITGDGATAGSIGLDLSGSLYPGGQPVTPNMPNISLATGAGQTAAISGVATGVLLGDVADGTAGAYLRYGNQTPTGSGGSGSSIAVNSGGFTLDTTHLTSTTAFEVGRYEFTGVSFTGNASFQSTAANFYFVAAVATGTGDGSSPSNLANATSLVNALNGNALANKTVVFVNDGSPIAFGTSALDLDSMTNLEGFGNGATIAAFTIPINVIIDSFSGTIHDPTGNGAATLTSTTAGNFIVLKDSHTIQNIDISGGATQISGNGFANLTLQGTVLSGATATEFSFTNPTGAVNITNNTITQSGGRLLSVNGGSGAISLTAGTGTISNTGGSGISVVNTTGGSVTLTGLSVTGATATPLTFDHNAATFNITGSTFAVNNGVTLLNIDTGTGNSTSDLTFGSTDTLTQGQGTIAIIGQGARNIDLSAQTFLNNIDTLATNAIESTGQSGGTISFGDVGISDFDGTTAVNLQGTGGAVTFKSLNVDTLTGAGVSTGGITFTPGTSQINATGGSALVMNGTTIGGGSETFGNVNASGPGAGNPGISLTNVTGTTLFTSVTVKVPAGTGINLNNAGTVTVESGNIDAGSGDGIHSVNTTLTATGLTIGATSAPTGNGITIVNNDGTARLVTLSRDTITAQGDGIHTTDGGHAGELSLVLDGNTLETTGAGSLAMNIVGSAAGSTTINSFNGVTVTGNGTGGGILFNTVTFSSVTGGSGQVTGGTAQIGTTANRVQGNGLNLQDPTGNLSFTALNIANNNGTGLLVNTKTPVVTTFTLGNGGGSVDTTNGTAMNIDPLTASLTFSNLKSTNAATNGVTLNTVGGTVALGAVSVTNATGTGLEMINSGAAVTASSVTVNGAATGLQFGTNTGGSFTVSGATSLTNITGTGINANGATGSYQFAGVTDTFSGAGRGIDLRNSDVTQFSTGSITITGDGTTAGSIGLDLSGSLYPGGQPVTNNAPNISLATGAGQTAAISGVTTGVLLGDGVVGSAGAYLRYGNQTAGNSGSIIAVNSGGVTINTTDLTTTSAFMQGRYEFTGVTFTGKATFESSSTSFIFVGSASAGADTGGDPNDRISLTQFLASDNTAAFLAGKTVVFINDNGGAGLNLGPTTLNLGTTTTIDGFGNGATVITPGGVQPVNVIGDNFHASGGSFTDANGAATLTANSGINVITLGNGDIVQNIDINAGNNQIIGSGIAGFTLSGVIQTNAGTSAISLTNSTGTISMTGGSISGAAGPSFLINGGSSTVTYSGSITNTAGHSVEVENRTGGSVTVSGTIHDTGTGILVTGNSGGTTTFSGTGSTINTGANQAVTLSSNTGSTTDFSGGSLAITTTSATGFGATGGGTVGVTGSSNTISSTTGTALSLNGVAIDTNGFILKSVSDNGGTNGIALTNLTGGGTTGVQVTGTGSTAGSGGTIQNTTGAAVSLSTLGSLGGGVTLDNLNITGGGGIVGTTFGTLATANDSVSATGATVLSLTTGTITTGSNFSTLTASGTLTNGVLLSGVGGGFTASAGSLSSSSEATWSESGGTVSATYDGTITQNTAGANAVSVSSETAGTTTFGGAINAQTTTGNAINLTSNTGATIDFSNTSGNSDITTTTGNGFNITGGGTVNITGNNYVISTSSGTGYNATAGTVSATGTGNTITSTTGTGLSVTNATIAASGLTFQSISSGAAANDGIVLNTTGALGGLTVTGTGTAGSGGTISGKTGADGSTTSGIGIYLNSTEDVSLAYMDIEGNSNYGIRGNSVTNFTLNHSTVGVTATNGTSATADVDATGYAGEGSIRFYDLAGTNAISNSTVDRGFFNSLAISNDTGTMTMTISNSTINNSLTASTSSDAIYFQTTGSSTVATLTVNTGSKFQTDTHDAIETFAKAASTMTINILGNSFENTNTGMQNGSNILLFNATGANTFVTFDIENNTFTQGNGTTASSEAGRILTAGTTDANNTSTGTFYGTLIGNTFGVAGVANSGGGLGADNVGLFINGNNSPGPAGHGASEFLVQNNIFQEYGQTGLQVGVTGGTSTIDITFLGNTFRDPASAALGAFAGIWGYAGANAGDTNTLNILIGSAATSANKNVLTGSDPNGVDDVFFGSDTPGNNSVINLSKAGSTSTDPGTVIVDDNTVPAAEAYSGDGITTINVVGTTPPIPPP